MSLLAGMALGAARVAPVVAGTVLAKKKADRVLAAAGKVELLLGDSQSFDRIRTATQLKLLAVGVPEDRARWTSSFLSSDEGQTFVRAVCVYALGSVGGQARTLSALAVHASVLMALYERAEKEDHLRIAEILLGAVETFVRETAARLEKQDPATLRILKAEARQASRDGHLTQAVYLEPRNAKISKLATIVGANLSAQTGQYAERAVSDFSTMSIPTLGRPILAKTSDAVVNPRLSERDALEDASLRTYLPDTGGTLGQFVRVMQRTVLIGNGGGGKSTLVRAAALELAQAVTRSEGNVLPFVVTLRHLAAYLRTAPTSGILKFMGQNLRENWGVDMPNETLRYLLHVGRAAVFFDGLDEVLAVEERSQIAERIWHFADGFPASFMVVTSRSEGYDEAPVPGFSTEWQLHAFEEDQIRGYTDWLLGVQGVRAERSVEQFMTESRDISDLRSNPLMLGILATLYGHGRSLPGNRELLYSKCAEMIFSEWDYSKGLSLAFEDQDSVSSAIKALALDMFSEGVEEISERDLRLFLEGHFKTEPGLGREQAKRIAKAALKSWKGRQWVLVFIGERHGEAYFRFSHRSFLEYFAAEEVVYQASNAKGIWSALENLVRERAAVQFCLLAAEMFSNRSRENGPRFLARLVKSINATSQAEERFTMLLFGAECLPIVRSDGPIRNCVYDLFLGLLGDLLPDQRRTITSNGVREWVIPPVFAAPYNLSERTETVVIDNDLEEEYGPNADAWVQVDHLAIPVAWIWSASYEVSRDFERAALAYVGVADLPVAAKVANFLNTISRVASLREFGDDTRGSVARSGGRIWKSVIKRGIGSEDLGRIGKIPLAAMMPERSLPASTIANFLGPHWLFMGGTGVTSGPDADRHAPAYDLALRVLCGDWTEDHTRPTMTLATDLLSPTSSIHTSGEFQGQLPALCKFRELNNEETALVLALLLAFDDSGHADFVDKVLAAAGEGRTGYSSPSSITWLEQVLWTMRIPTILAIDRLLEDERPEWVSPAYKRRIDALYLAHAR